MKVAIILINWKNYAKKYLPDCISSLRQVSFPEGEYKLFVVDNESSEETRTFIKNSAPEAEILVNNENVGYGEGNNTGLRQAKSQGYDYFYLLNMDTAVEPDFLSQAIKVYQNTSSVGLLQSRIMLFDQKDKVNSIGNVLHFLGFGYCKGYLETFSRDEVVDEIIYPSGSGLLVSKEVLEKIGYFTPEFFMYHDDVEMGLKSRLAGYKNVIANRSIVYHKYEFTRSASIKHFYMERNRFLVWLMSLKIPTLIILFPAWLLMEIGLMLFAIKGGWWKYKLKVYAWFFSLKNWKLVIKLRNETQKLRTVKDRQLMHDFVGVVEYQEPELQNWLLRKIVNPCFKLYWAIIKKIIFW